MWLSLIFQRLCFETGRRYAFYTSARDFSFDLMREMEKTRVSFATYADPQPEFLLDLKGFRGVHIVRDPRDVLVSGYFSHKESHPTENWIELEEHRQLLKSISIQEGLFLELSFSEPFFNSLALWEENPCVMELKFEQLVVNEFENIIKILQWLDFVWIDDCNRSSFRRFMQDLMIYVNLIQSKIGVIAENQRVPELEHAYRVIARNTFLVKSGGRGKGQSLENSHLRKGVSGDWRNHFDERLAAAFRERYQSILEKYGYEADTRWVERFQNKSLKNQN